MQPCGTQGGDGPSIWRKSAQIARVQDSQGRKRAANRTLARRKPPDSAAKFFVLLVDANAKNSNRCFDAG
jgi:hypothetical protein